MTNNENDVGYFCVDCGATVSLDDEICPKCGSDVSKLDVEPEQNEKSTQTPLESKYPILRGIAELLKVASIITFILSIFAGGLVWGEFGGSTYSFLIPIMMVLCGIITAILLLAVSEIIKVFIDIEENTRRTAEMLRQIN